MLTVPDKPPERPVDYKEMDINRLCLRGVKKDELAAQPVGAKKLGGVAATSAGRPTVSRTVDGPRTGITK